MEKTILRGAAIVAGLALSFGVVRTEAAIIDDFSSGSLGDWTDTRILKAHEGADNVYSWEVSGEVLQLNTTTYNGIEQFAFTRTDVTLGVGFELVGAFAAAFTGPQDIGLYVGAGHPTPDVRADYVNVYFRDNGQLFSRGFNGTIELSLSGGAEPAVDALFIARTSLDTFELGWYEGETRNVLVTRTMANTSLGDSIGFYADVRGTGAVSGFDSVSIIPEPSTYALMFGVAGLALAVYRRRKA